MKYCRRLACCLLLIVYCFVFPSSVFGEGEIESSQQVVYEVLENGETKVRHQIKLTNLTTNYYASEYALFLGYSDITAIAAFDSQGALVTHITPKENGTEIRLNFNDQVVGKGKVLAFTISYETGEVASKNGRIWEINIPKIKNAQDVEDYTTSVSVPPSFGKPAYIKPANAGKDLRLPLTFAKEDVVRGISIAFGEYQIFDYTLTYHLQNKRLYPIITEIALPPQTAYQDILLDRLEPAPLTVYEDADGNWLAKYRLDASERLDVVAFGKAKISPVAQFNTSTKATNLDMYLKPQKYWETLDPKISQKAKELKTPQAIYNFVVETLTYDYARIDKNLPRAGALEVLSNPKSAICMEFTDLFIALARAAGIAAREVDGFAYAQNAKLRPISLVKDILHAWPEYYDREKNMWIPVDPTWGNTSGVEYFDALDFNHFAFVIKGVDSEYPSPAGSYKESEDLEKQDVEITFAKVDTFNERRSILLTSDIEDTLLAGFSTSGRMLIANEGNRVIPENELAFFAPRLLPASQTYTVGPIPPFGKAIIPLSLKSPSYIDTFSTDARASFVNKEITQTIHIRPIYLIYLPWIGGGIGAALIFFFAHKAWNLYFQRPKGGDSLRGKSQQPPKPRFKLPW